MASIRRDNDLVPNIEGSGLYFGLAHWSADYPLAPGIGLRPEFLYSTTIFQSPTLRLEPIGVFARLRAVYELLAEIFFEEPECFNS
jgi:hypothetical protein